MRRRMFITVVMVVFTSLVFAGCTGFVDSDPNHHIVISNNDDIRHSVKVEVSQTEGQIISDNTTVNPNSDHTILQINKSGEYNIDIWINGQSVGEEQFQVKELGGRKGYTMIIINPNGSVEVIIKYQS